MDDLQFLGLWDSSWRCLDAPFPATRVASFSPMQIIHTVISALFNYLDTIAFTLLWLSRLEDYWKLSSMVATVFILPHNLLKILVPSFLHLLNLECLSSWLLASAWSNANCCRHLSSEAVNGRHLCLHLPPYNSTFYRNKQKTKSLQNKQKAYLSVRAPVLGV